MAGYMDDVATGPIGDGPRLRIAGRPRQGGSEKLVILEEPGEPVQIHYAAGANRPHFKRDCPYCAGAEEAPLKLAWYVGAVPVGSTDPVILELTQKCYQSALAAARRERGKEAALLREVLDGPAPPIFRGLLVAVSRGDWRASPRVLRCLQRVEVHLDWSHETRRELARIWGIPVRPRLHRAEGDGA